jgi:hypothetical protein
VKEVFGFVKENHPWCSERRNSVLSPHQHTVIPGRG